MSRYKCRRWCFVPQCQSTSDRNPDKVFFPIPNDPETKKLWFNLAHRAGEPTTSRYYCCQDHFELKEDMDNYIRYSMFGGPVKLKENVVPHIFDCQNRFTSQSNVPRPAFEKLTRKRAINDILKENADMNKFTRQMNASSTSNSNIQSPNSKRRALISVENADTNNDEEIDRRSNIQSSPDKKSQSFSSMSPDVAVEHSEMLKNSGRCDVPSPAENPVMDTVSLKIPVFPEDVNQEFHSTDSLSTMSNPSNPWRILNFGESIPPEQSYKRLKDHGVQVNKYFGKPHVRSSAVMCKPKVREVACQQVIQKSDQACSPIKELLKNTESESCTISSLSTQPTSTTTTSDSKLTSDDLKSLESEFSCSEDEKYANQEMRMQALNVTNYLISISPKYYVGLTQEWFWVIDLLHAKSGVAIYKIKLTLMKIRLNDNFSRLGDLFGLSESQAGRIFSNTVPALAHFLKTLVYPVPKSSIKKNLPIPFRANFNDVYIIIDTFEVEIQKPSNPLYQALTWSEYKKCNTLKFIIAITPDGTIVFISFGYGGRISDVLLFEICGIMDIIPENCGVMADRGFKQIDSILARKNCKLIRPPTVSTSIKPSKEEVILTKRIASLRIHVERIIRRVREFKMLEPHAVIDLRMMPSVDDIVMIVSALINLQNPVIKT